MNVARLRTHDFREVGQECNDVMFDLGLDRIDAGDVEFCRFDLFPNLLRGVFWNDADLGHSVGRVALDLERNAKVCSRGPDCRHFGAGVARYGHAASPRASAAALRIAAMLGLEVPPLNTAQTATKTL